MKKAILAIVFLATTICITAQTAPTGGKKTLEVKQTFEGEYNQDVRQGTASNAVIKAMKSRVPKKLAKYGFTDITIIDIGQARVPENWTDKLAQVAGGNKAVGEAQLQQAETYSEIKQAVDKMHTPDDYDNWQFQVNFKDNITDKIFKVRLSLTYNPKYIIKEQ
ncbi:hypothetical protein [Aquimarina celericrescens]|uniref:Beta-lactamase-inhibitor-like PepSY-like domain-containing protein n=1 Tax=Aquimarina celericrescens TaxID=1964542 RepID=A0ABW5AV06_9FLAO|nr:hypothetical protein [Aquimarina celericrescens]